MVCNASQGGAVLFLVVAAHSVGGLWLGHAQTVERPSCEQEDDLLLLQLGLELQAPPAAPARIDSEPATGQHKLPCGQHGCGTHKRASLLELQAPWEDASRGDGASQLAKPQSRPHAFAAHLWQHDHHQSYADQQLALLELSTTGAGAVAVVFIVLILLILLIVVVWLYCLKQPQEEGKRPRRGVNFDDNRSLLAQPEVMNSSASAVPTRRQSTASAGSMLSSLSSSPLLGNPGPPTAAELPPAIAPALVVTGAEVRFYLEVHRLTQVQSQKRGLLELFSPTGKKHFDMKLEVNAMGSKSLSLSTQGSEDDPRAVVVNSFDFTNRLQILAKRGALYGEMETTSEGAVVSSNGSQVMELTTGDKENQEVTLTTMSGKQLATGAYGPMKTRWHFQAINGFDAVLGVITAVALVLEM